MKKKEPVIDMISFSDFGKKGKRNAKIEKFGFVAAVIGLAAVSVSRYLDWKQTTSIHFTNTGSANRTLSALREFFLNGTDGDKIELMIGPKDETEEAPAE